MKSTAHIGGHPIHPMLIPYPLALLTSAAAFDVGARLGNRYGWDRTASHLSGAGLATGLLAAIPGLIDYFGTVPAGTETRRTATRHALLNAAALACFGLAHATRRFDRSVSGTGLLLELAGVGLLSLGGWLGGELVYGERVGVHGRPAGATEPARRGDATAPARRSRA